jgi:hypothetical protein
MGLLDGGPLVSLLACELQRHDWIVKQMERLRPPLLTCEPGSSAAWLGQVSPLGRSRPICRRS